MPAPDQDGRRRVAGQEIRTRILPILAMPKSDILIYFLAALLGLCSGILEVTVGDLLATALFVLISTLVLGFVRPKRPGRWTKVRLNQRVPPYSPVDECMLPTWEFRSRCWPAAAGEIPRSSKARIRAFWSTPASPAAKLSRGSSRSAVSRVKSPPSLLRMSTQTTFMDWRRWPKN